MRTSLTIKRLMVKSTKNLLGTLCLIFCLSSTVLPGQTWLSMKDVGTTVSGTASASPPLGECLSLSLNGKIYVVGNKTYTSTTPVAMLWEYDPMNDDWKQRSVYPGNGN